MKTRIIELSVKNRKERIILPINPGEVKFSEKQMNQIISLLNLGEVNMKGERGLKTTELSSFFPSSKSPFFKKGMKKPAKYIEMIENWKISKQAVRVIITDMRVDLAMLIDNFQFSMKEGDEDIYFSISLSEYRDLNVRPVKKKGKKEKKKNRPKTKEVEGKYTVKKGDTLWGIAKKHYGKGIMYKKIYEANKNVIEASAKKHGQKNSRNGSFIYVGDTYLIT